MAGDIFISYRRRDLEHVREVERLLLASGFDESQIFRDERGLRPGGDFRQQLKQTLQRTRLVLAVIGLDGAPTDREDDWLTIELAEAVMAKKPVCLITLDGADDELKKPWPSEVESTRSPEALRLHRRSRQSQRELASLVRRFGVSPRRSIDRWNKAFDQLPITAFAAEIQRLMTHSATDVARVVVVHGAPGNKRGAVMRAVTELLQAETSAPVAWHDPLYSTLVDVSGAALYDWIGRLIDARPQLTRLAFIDHLGFSSTHLPASTITALRQQCKEADLAQHQATELATIRTVRIAAATSHLAQAAEDEPAFLLLDDAALADVTSQQLALALAASAGDDHGDAMSPGLRIILSVDDDTALLRDLRRLDERAKTPFAFVEVNHDAMKFLVAAGLDEEAAGRFAAFGYSIAQYVTLLRVLDDDGVLRRTAGGALGLRSDRAIPAIEEALDRELRPMLPVALQQTLAVGAVYGMSFPFDIADQVVSGGSGDVAQLLHEVSAYDPDGHVVQVMSTDPPRLRFSQRLWRDHFSDQRLRGLLPDQRDAELTSLARALAASATRYEDRIAAAELFDRANRFEDSATQYLRAAGGARADLSVEAASLAYAAAAERFASHAVRLTPVIDAVDRARQFVRAGYCWFRSISTSTSVLNSADASQRAESCLDLAVHELASLARSPGVAPPATDLDTMVLSPDGVATSRHVRLRLECASLRGFVAAQRGAEYLFADAPSAARDLNGAKGAADAFKLALSQSEEGLRGWIYEVLVIVASAGLARSYAHSLDAMQVDERENQVELKKTIHFHAARAQMLLARLDRRSIPRSEREAVQLVDQAGKWAADAQFVTLRGAGSRPGGPLVAGDELALIDMLYALAEQMTRPSHSRKVAELAKGLLGASDLEHVDDLLERDAEIAALAHDLFRGYDGSRMLQLCRDLDENVTLDEWRNPVLLHGRIASRYLDFGLGARAILGERRFRRICYAIDNHTLGMTKTDEQDATIDNSERTLTRLLCIADDSARPDTPAFADEAMLPGQFALTYEKALRLQADRLTASGRMLSTR